jgi:hypothetical protein
MRNVDHDDPATGDAGDALGPAPQPGQVEAYAAYRVAWRALGRPEIDREETELSDGQLRMRVRAWEREKPWSPRYVGNELAGTRQAAAHQHRVAALRAARSPRCADLGGNATLVSAAARASRASTGGPARRWARRHHRERGATALGGGGTSEHRHSAMAGRDHGIAEVSRSHP